MMNTTETNQNEIILSFICGYLVLLTVNVGLYLRSMFNSYKKSHDKWDSMNDLNDLNDSTYEENKLDKLD